MPRGPRLDSRGILHHVIARGIERGTIFRDDDDREDFLDRLARIARAGNLRVFAWALMPNHVHLLVRTAAQPLERSMRSLLAGYASRFNRRHQRAGHLFQNRFKSIVCEDEPYFLTLVRYIHRNPVPTVVADLGGLASYPYTGHSAVLGVVSREWQDVASVLDRFEAGNSRQRYLQFVNEEAAHTVATDLEGGGLTRSRGVWSYVPNLLKGRERFKSDERILGTSVFVERALAELTGDAQATYDLRDLIDNVCRSLDLSPEVVRAGGRRRIASRAREALAYLWTVRLGQSNRALALELGLAESSLHNAALRGTRDADRWDSLFVTFLAEAKEA